MKYFTTRETKSLVNVQSKNLESIQKSARSLQKLDRKWSLRRGKSWQQAETINLPDGAQDYLDDTQLTHLCDDFSININCVERKATVENDDNLPKIKYQAISTLPLTFHNNMKPATKAFIRNKNDLKNFQESPRSFLKNDRKWSFRRWKLSREASTIHRSDVTRDCLDCTLHCNYAEKYIR